MHASGDKSVPAERTTERRNKMRTLITISSTLALLTILSGTAFSQTSCVWIERFENGKAVSKVGLSYNVAKAIAGGSGDFDLNGTKVTFDTLLYAYRTRNTVHIPDSIGRGETKIYGGTFREPMEKGTHEHNFLVIESTDSTGAVKVTKLRSASVQAVGVILAMIGSKDPGRDIDKIESVLEPGGILYIRDMGKKSKIWIYVN